MRPILFVYLFCFFQLSTAFAGELPSGDFTSLKLIGTKKVSNVVDPQTIQLENGDLYHLTGLDIPDFHPYTPGPVAQMALQVLEDLLIGKSVSLYQTNAKDGGLKNRFRHHIAQLELKDDKVWVQGALLSLGLARVRTLRSNTEMANQMYALETQARNEGLGLWAFPDYQIRKADDVLKYENSFQIVEGRVVSAGQTQNRIYLNFGKNWKDDFTVTITPEHRKRFFKSKFDPMGLNNRVIRVRGWVEEYNGPFIEIDHPERIEVLGEKS